MMTEEKDLIVEFTFGLSVSTQPVKLASSLSPSTPPTGKMPVPQRDILLYLLTLAIADKIRDELCTEIDYKI